MPETKRIHLPVVQKGSNAATLEPLALPSSPFVPQDVPSLALTPGELLDRKTLRASSYTIYVDLPGNPDEMLLVHGYTGAYDRVSKRVATYLRSLETRRAPKPLYGDWTPEPAIQGEVVKPSDEIISILKQRGYLVALTPDEEEALFVKVATKYQQAAIQRMPSYVLMPTYQCNLRCPYCFQDHMRTDPAYSHLLRVMDRTMADRILEGMRNIDAAHEITDHADVTRSITFFGGEPLLAESRPIVEYLIARIRERGKASISAVTNATELDAYRDLLGGEGISQLQITLDGPPAEHDKRRIYEDGSGSFERIAANIDMALDLGVHVSIRLNVDRGNLSQLPVLADEFHARGWAERRNFQAYAAPVHPGNEQVDPRGLYDSWQLGRALDQLKEHHPRLARLGTYDNTLQQQAQRIFDGRGTEMPRFRSSFCGAHTSMYVIDAFADIYACWERTGDPSLRIGHIDERGQVLMSRAVLERWRGRTVASNPVCRKCRYATSCGGGCAVLAEDEHGDAYSNHCDGYAKRFRASIAETYVAYSRGEKRDVTDSRLCDM